MKRATVRWADSHYRSGSISPDALEELHRPMFLRTTGFVARDDKSGISIVMDSHEDPENEGLDPADLRHYCFIPRSCIRSIEWLEPK